MRNVIFVVVFLINFVLVSSEVSFAQTLSAPEGFVVYQVKQGDALNKIAPCEHWDLIKRINKIDENHLPAGKNIFIPVDLEKAITFLPIPQSIEEAKNKVRSLYVFLDSQYFGAYENGNLSFWGPISSGKKNTGTPKGNFRVNWKTKNYNSKKYDATMPFAINISDDGLFIHEQALPGKPASHGCVRLLREDAKKIYSWIEKNDPVIIN